MNLGDWLRRYQERLAREASIVAMLIAEPWLGNQIKENVERVREERWR